MVPQSLNHSSFCIHSNISGYIIRHISFRRRLFALINHPITSFYNSNTGQFFFLYPDISNQFISDTLIAVSLYGLGFVGLLAIYQSTKSAYKPRQAYMLLIVGVALLLLAYVFLEGSISFKVNGGR